MEFPLDPEQRQAVETSGVSVILTAGAGCGKTGTLTARFLYLMGKRDDPERLAPPEDRVPVGRIGVLTFTNKAAAELRHRIRKACELEASRHRISAGIDRKSAEAAHYWELVSFAVDGMTISTYHAFYERMVRDFAESLELDPEVRLLDERIAAGLKREAAREAVRERLAACDPVAIEYAARHRLDGVVDQLVTLLGLGEHQTRVSEIVVTDPEELAEKWLRAWEKQAGQGADRIERLVRRIIGLPPAGFTANWIEKTRTAAEALANPELERIEAVVAAVQALSGNSPRRPELLELLAELREFRDSEAFDLMQADRDLMDLAAAETICLASMVESARDRYDELKRRRRAVDFDDLVLKARELAASGMALRGRTGGIFDHFLVDEFQDTDRLQSAVLQMLAGSSFGTGALFVVGDVKQAIYRFRGSDPEALLELRDSIPPEGHLSLTCNYRSRRAIVEFVNHLARSMYGEENGDPSLRSGLRTRAALADEPPAIEMLWTIPRPQNTEQERDSSRRSEISTEGFEAQRAEAANLAAHLRRLVDAGIPVGARRSDDRLVNAKPGDIVLLSRSRTHWRIYERAFAREGFEVHQDAVGGFFDRQEIRDLVGLLAAVEHRTDDLRLAACLRSPLFAVTDDTLYALARPAAGKAEARLVDRFWNQDEDELAFVGNEERATLQRAREIMDELNRAKGVLEPSRIVRLAIELTSYDVILREIADEPERALANLDALVDDARSFDRDPDFGWPAMIRQWIADLDSGARFEEAVVDAPAGRIRFLTIHAAKGLEFPVVIMPGLNSPAPSRTGPFQTHPAFGLVTRSRIPDDESDGGDHPAWEIATLCQRSAEDRETDNLLYVAGTRAMDRLILSAVFDPAAVNRDGTPKSPAGPFLKRLARAFDLNTGQALMHGPETPPRIAVHRFEEFEPDVSTA